MTRFYPVMTISMKILPVEFAVRRTHKTNINAKLSCNKNKKVDI